MLTAKPSRYRNATNAERIDSVAGKGVNGRRRRTQSIASLRNGRLAAWSLPDLLQKAPKQCGPAGRCPVWLLGNQPVYEGRGMGDA